MPLHLFASQPHMDPGTRKPACDAHGGQQKTTHTTATSGKLSHQQQICAQCGTRKLFDVVGPVAKVVEQAHSQGCDGPTNRRYQVTGVHNQQKHQSIRENDHRALRRVY
jgi:hypothetical protein